MAAADETKINAEEEKKKNRRAEAGRRIMEKKSLYGEFLKEQKKTGCDTYKCRPWPEVPSHEYEAMPVTFMQLTQLPGYLRSTSGHQINPENTLATMIEPRHLGRYNTLHCTALPAES